MRAKSKKRTKLLAIMVIVIMLMNVGYAFLKRNMKINGNATMKNKSWNIYFTNVQPTTGSVTPTTAPTTSGTSTTTLTWVASMDTPGQFYEFTVDAVNNGTIDAMINTATEDIVKSTLTRGQRRYLDYTVKYSDGAEVEQYDRLAAGATEKLRIRVEFKNNITPSELPGTAQQVTFTYTANYVQADDNAKTRRAAPGSPTIIGGTVQIGDRVNYNPGNATTEGLNLPEGISLPDGDINVADSSNWRVLDVDENTGEIKIIPTTVSLNTIYIEPASIQGYNNSIKAINTIAGLYKNVDYAESAKSLTLEDVNKVTGYDPIKASASGYEEESFTGEGMYEIDEDLNIIRLQRT